ncbi:MAG: Gfo/Idh/MocA family protein [Planctomycetaceae bacterium]
MKALDARVRLGIVGCGRVTNTLHLPALRHVPEIEVAALADRDENQLRLAAANCGVAASYTSYVGLLENPAIDAVAVCVPPQYHAEVAWATLDAGKHLFVEKPLALSLSECDRLIGQASRLSCKAQVGLNLRQHRLIRAARQIIADGELGELELLRSSFTAATRRRVTLPAWRDVRESGGGALTEIGTHHFDLWRFLTGGEVQQVFVCSRNDATEDVSASITARMTNGALVSGVMSERTYGSNELEILGLAGRLHINLYAFDGLDRSSTWEHAGDLSRRLRRLIQTLARLPRGIASRRRGGEFLLTYQRQWQRFANAILRDGPIDATLEDGRAAAAISSACVASAIRGQPVDVDNNADR